MKTQNSTRSLCGRFLTAIGLVLMTAATVRADYQSTVLADHPVAYYPINSNVDPVGITATDVSGNGNNGIYNGTDPEFNTVPGPSAFITNALSFDGNFSYIDLSTGPNTAILNFGGQITMEAWVQPTNTTQGPNNIIAKGYASSDNSEITLRANNDGSGHYQYTGGSYDGNFHGATGGQQTTNWVYLVCTYDGTNWNMYVNSVLAQSNPDATGSINCTNFWAIGNGTGDYGGSRFFNGNITQVALYTNYLTAAQVLNHFCMGELGTSPGSSKPIIVAQPQPQSAFTGGTVTFSVGVASALPTTNLWFKNGVGMAGKTNATLTLNNVGGADAVNYSVVVGDSNGTTNSLSASLTVLAAGNSLKWNSGGSNGVWDTGISADWLNLSTSVQTNFNTNDQVLFDDTIGVSNIVTINGTVSPSLITVNTSTNSFTFVGGSSPLISGPGSLVKEGSSTFTNFSSANFAGLVTISGGSMYAGNNCFASVASITITNNATLDIGGGQLTGNKPVVVSGTGVNGEGAIYDSYPYDLPANVLNITLAGNTVFGGSSRWDLVNGSQISGPYNLTINWSSSGGYGEWDSVSIAANVGNLEVSQGQWAIKGMGDRMGDPTKTITVDPGTSLTVWGSSFGPNSGYNKNIHVLTNGIMAIRPQNPNTYFNANVTLEGGAQWDYFNGSGAGQTINGTYLLNGIVHMLIGDSTVTFTNVISGTGGFVWDAYGPQTVFTASNTYSGPTVIGSGLKLVLSGSGSISHSSLIFFGGSSPINVSLDVTGRPDNTLTLASGQTLGGLGTINGNLVVSAGATISPSGTNITLGLTEGTNTSGTIAASGVTLNGTTILKLDGSGVNDQVQAANNIAYGGTLSLVNISGSPLAVGNSFQVFNATTYSGSFASITPAKPGPGLAWDLSQLNTSGFVNVESQPVINSVRVLGGNLIFSGTNGTLSGSYSVLTTTNLTTPLSSWLLLSSGTYDGTGAFSVTNAISPGVPQRFYIIQQ